MALTVPVAAPELPPVLRRAATAANVSSRDTVEASETDKLGSDKDAMLVELPPPLFFLFTDASAEEVEESEEVRRGVALEVGVPDKLMGVSKLRFISPV